MTVSLMVIVMPSIIAGMVVFDVRTLPSMALF